MTNPWIAPGSHSVLFYEDEPSLHRTIAQFLTDDARPGDVLVLVCRPATLAAVAGELASGRYGSALAPDLFVDAAGTLPRILSGTRLDENRARDFFAGLLEEARSRHPDGTIRLYSDIVNLLCEQGQHTVAVDLEGLAPKLLEVDPRLAILCAYDVRHFDADPDAARLLAICQKHTHVISPDEILVPEATTRQAGFLSPARDAGTPSGDAREELIYVVDDDASVRRSLTRLLALSKRPVRGFETAEAFLSELDGLSRGCLVLDIQLPGMSGLDLLARLREVRPEWPVILMSGSHDHTAEDEARRLGARAFLEKPFEPDRLFDALAALQTKA